MIVCRFKIILSSNFTNLSEFQVKLHEFSLYFENNFKCLESLILEKPSDNKNNQKEKIQLINDKILKILKEKNEMK